MASFLCGSLYFFQILIDNLSENSENIEYAGPTEELPTGLKHIRGETSKEEENKSKTGKV